MAHARATHFRPALTYWREADGHWYERGKRLADEALIADLEAQRHRHFDRLAAIEPEWVDAADLTFGESASQLQMNSKLPQDLEFAEGVNDV